MSVISPKFLEGQRAYYVLFSTVEIVPVEIIAIHLYSQHSSEPVSYKIQLVNRLKPTFIEFVEESKLLTFSQSKIYLLSWLETQKIRITNLTEPTV